MLTDPLTLDPITDAIKTYFRENTTDDVSPLTIWEAHKCVLRGKLMTLATQIKKASEKEPLALLTKVQKLETQHKLTVAIKVADDLSTACKELQAKLDLQAKRILFFRQGFFMNMVIRSANFWPEL